MTKSRLEAFSDGVIAIIITIMVLEMKVPHGADFESLKPMLPVMFYYLLSFIYLGIYWSNHHHLIHTAKHVNGAILWANLHLLFWLSLIPFTTHWMGANIFAPLPVAVYGLVLLLAACAYYILTRVLILSHGTDSALAKAIGNDIKGKLSIVCYIMGILASLFNTFVSNGFYIAVALLWFAPDRRLEKTETS